MNTTTRLFTLMAIMAALTVGHARAERESTPEEGITVTYEGDKVPQCTEVVPPVGTRPSSGTMGDGASCSDDTEGGGAKLEFNASAYSATYNISMDKPSVGTVTAQGTARVEGSVAVSMSNAFGYARAGARGLARVKIGTMVATAEDTAGISIVHDSSNLIGGNFAFLGFGGGFTTTIQKAGDGEKSKPIAKTDATVPIEAYHAVVTLEWETEASASAEKQTSTGPKPAMADASASVTSAASVIFVLHAKQVDAKQVDAQQVDAQQVDAQQV